MYYPEVFNSTITFILEHCGIDHAHAISIFNATRDCVFNTTIEECWMRQYDVYAPLVLPLRNAPFFLLLFAIVILLIGIMQIVGEIILFVYRMALVVLWIFLIFPFLVGFHVVQWCMQKWRGGPLPPPPQPPLQAAIHHGLILAARTAG
jgi:hypothetical protein